MKIRFLYRLTVFGACNEILGVQEFSSHPSNRQKCVDDFLRLFDGEWHFYVCSKIG